MRILKIPFFAILYAIGFNSQCLTQQQKVYIYDNNNCYAHIVKKALDTFNINYEAVNSIVTNDENLYIIFDIQSIAENQLPKYYITYQTLDLSRNGTTPSYINKLVNAVAVWDYSQNNINHYSSRIYNYYYMPENYEHVDPVILPCFLPSKALMAYKNILTYSNQKNTDISSHLPTLFVHCVNSNPSLVVEAGVRGGESTVPLQKACEYCKGKLIGIDILQSAATAYSSIPNAKFLCMDDMNFATYYRNSEFKKDGIDIIFIDTSHLYQHTLQEITQFVPLLKEDGMLLFHDSNVTPLNNNVAYTRLNGSMDSAPGNTRGVTQAIKEYFSIDFNEYTYTNFTFTKDATAWNITHYPFCNGLTMIKKINLNNEAAI